MRFLFYPMLLCCCFIVNINAQNCASNEIPLEISIKTDQFGAEVYWQVTDIDGNIYAQVFQNTYGNNESYDTTVCVPNSCLTFTMLDGFGDGICCQYGDGSYSVMSNGTIIASGGTYTNYESTDFNCGSGESCTTAIPMSEGIHTAATRNIWYAFTPAQVGTYGISACNNNCDTKIWVYGDCNPASINEGNDGTLFYNDNSNNCGTQAYLEGYFDQGVTYLIRIGDASASCSGAIDWELSYIGAVSGCTDPNSCNFNPLATIDDGSCIAQGDPNCPQGPDLVISQGALESSIYLTTYNNTDACAISEGCIGGYGQRDIIRFTTRIANIGELDYFIGSPSSGDATQFTYDNCHNHYHYVGYAEYILFGDDGTEIPVGFKNGFCVLDLSCDGGGNAQYSCSNMGISANCEDTYSSGLDCQWIDITDVEDGRYTFVTRVNWDNSPDANGNLEKDTTNNWAQVCVIIDRTSGLQISLDPNCDPYVDCAGTPYGSAQPDCEGVCGGPLVRGDLNASGAQEMTDAQQYVADILGNDISPTSCNDLNADNAITVYDASLLASCLNFGNAHAHNGAGAHDHCNFPDGVYNPNDMVTLSIIGADFDNNTIDIGILNPTVRVNAYQFKMSGVSIASVTNLVNTGDYTISPSASLTDGMVIGISYEDSTIVKSNTVQPLCRINYLNIDSEFCISEVIDVVSGPDFIEQVATQVDANNACMLTACEEPAMVSTDVIGGKVVKVLWEPRAGAEKYKVRLRVSGVGAPWSELNAYNTYRFINGLMNNTTYQYSVKTVCSGGRNSVWSPTQTFTTTADLCDRPAIGSTLTTTMSTATITWPAVSDAIKYKVGYRRSGSSIWDEVYVNTNSATISGLQAGATYKFKVKSKCPGGWTNWNDKDEFITGATFVEEDEEQSFKTKGVDYGISLSPNPAKDVLNISVLESKPTEMRVSTITGKVMQTILVDGITTQLDISNLPEGVYYLDIIFENDEKVTQRFVKVF